MYGLTPLSSQRGSSTSWKTTSEAKELALKHRSDRRCRSQPEFVPSHRFSQNSCFIGVTIFFPGEEFPKAVTKIIYSRIRELETDLRANFTYFD